MSLTNFTETLNRAPAARCECPSSTNATTRSRSAIGCDLPISCPHICHEDRESQSKPSGNPESDRSQHALETQIARRAKEDETSRRLTTIPGIGPIIATAIAALAPPASTFKMGNRTLRRLLIIGASAVVRWAERKGAIPGSWLARMLERKPPMLIRVALANKMARIAWALMAHGGEYRAQVVTR